MSRSFTIDDGGDGDTLLSICLLLVAIACSVFVVRVVLPGIPTIYPAPIFVWLLAHFAYKWHFRRRLAAAKAKLAADGS